MGFTREKRIKVCFHQPRLWSTCVDSGFDSTTTTLSLPLPPSQNGGVLTTKKTKKHDALFVHTRFSQWDELPMSTVTSAAHPVEVRQKHVWNGALLLRSPSTTPVHSQLGIKVESDTHTHVYKYKFIQINFSSDLDN